MFNLLEFLQEWRSAVLDSYGGAEPVVRPELEHIMTGDGGLVNALDALIKVVENESSKDHTCVILESLGL